jgi:hypothetical protein
MEVRSTKETAEIERQTIKEKATRHIVQSHEEHLKLLAKAYVWAVRAEMMQGNINQVNLFASDMVKEKNFQRIVIANDKGIIVSSTNKKDEGQPFSAIADEAALSSNNTTVQNESDSILILTSPIMGFNNRLGTLLIKYAVKPARLLRPNKVTVYSKVEWNTTWKRVINILLIFNLFCMKKSALVVITCRCRSCI